MELTLTSILDLTTVPAFLGQPSTPASAPRYLTFSFDEDSQRVTGKDAARVQALVDEALLLGYAGSAMPCFNYPISAPITPAMLGAILHTHWDIQGKLPLPDVDEAALFVPEIGES
ncbi:N-acyl-D-aspartate deacylase-N-acyl-D-aspartate amidohydrolase [Moritella viscosa]|uniref:hypothetical protein n=1 Tax=Moritella viscosa TaxID=80854 RepID=UPI0005091B99|nr:hypothetical protein [Moritella viscosa]CED61144.1 putative uncharacterized phage gene [Moritella viscosa]SHO20113.1 N-acyl-D-aspartate deacylase-N-acyl-D-aspartate amidohydrolase [Moritella viscosa]